VKSVKVQQFSGKILKYLILQDKFADVTTDILVNRGRMVKI